MKVKKNNRGMYGAIGTGAVVGGVLGGVSGIGLALPPALTISAGASLGSFVGSTTYEMRRRAKVWYSKKR